MGKIRQLIRSIFEHLSWWQLLFGGSIVSIFGWISNWAASQTEWIVARGPYAVWLAVLLGMMVGVAILVGLVWLRYLWIKGAVTDRWAKASDDVNPLQREFHTQRIDMQIMAHPLDRTIRNKRFIDCELIGPTNIFAFQNVEISHTHFINCDFVICRPDAFVQTCTALVEVQIMGGRIYNCTIFGSEELISDMHGANVVTYGKPL